MRLTANQVRNILFTGLIILLMISSPVITLIILLFFLIYWHFFKQEAFTWGYLVNAMQRLNAPMFWLACALALASLAIHYRTGHVIYAGFPGTVIFYYDYPQTIKSGSLWENLTSKVAIHLLDGLLNIGFYYGVLWFLFSRRQSGSRPGSGPPEN